jgi:hypothetical protein
VETEQELLGKPLPRVDVELELSARRLDDGRVSVAWSVVGVASLPSFIVRMLPLESVTRGALKGLVEKAGLADAVELGADSLVVDLTRIALGPLGKGWLACDALQVPDGERALGAKIRIAPPSGAPVPDPYPGRP